jgi:Ribosome biogenesis protein Nop16
MIKKYRDDTDRMHRDIKINYLQWSEGQIKSKLKVYLKSLE